MNVVLVSGYESPHPPLPPPPLLQCANSINGFIP